MRSAMRAPPGGIGIIAQHLGPLKPSPSSIWFYRQVEGNGASQR